MGLVFCSPDATHDGTSEDVHEEHAVAAELVAQLAVRTRGRAATRCRDRASDLSDDHIGARVLRGLKTHAALDLVGDVRDDLHRVAEVLAAALARDHLRVDLAGGDVRGLGQVDVEEPLVVADVEVGLGAVVRDEDLTVLERVHRAGIDVQIRVELLHHDAQTAGP